MGLLKEQYAEWKKVPLQYCCNQVWMKNGGWGSMECYTYLRNFQDLVWWENSMWKEVRRYHLMAPVIPSGAMVEYHPVSAKDQSRLHQFGPKVLASIFLGYALYAGWNLERRHHGRRHWRIGGDGRIWTPRPKAQRKESANAAKKWKLHITSRRWNSQNFWRRSAFEYIHLNPGSPRPMWRTRNSSRRIRPVFFQPTSTIIFLW